MAATANTEQGAYRGGQYDLMVRGSGFLLLIGAVAVAVLLPFFPPTAQVGAGYGWAIAIATLIASLAVGVGQITLRSRPGMMTLYLSSFTGIAQAGGLQWLAGGGKAPYLQLMLIPMLGAGTGQPLWRCGRVLAAAFLVALTPLLYSTINLASTVVEFSILSIMTMMIAVVIASTRTHRARLKDATELAHELAHVDPLTGMANRRAFDETLDHAIAVARDDGTPISLLLCDVNSFKQINDTWGHAAGDDALQAIARALSDAMRRPDTAFRWAGDEFAVILRDADEESAARVAARLRDAVRVRARRPDGRPIEIGTGVAELKAPMSADDLLVKADEALFAHKAARAELRAAPRHIAA